MSNLAGLLNKTNGSNESATTTEKPAVAPEVAEETVEDRQPVLIATCLPIQNFTIGEFEFRKGVMNLYDEDKAEAFRKLLTGLMPADRNLIKIIDRAAAEAMVRTMEPSATKQFDSSVGRGQARTESGDSVVGTEALDKTD